MLGNGVCTLVIASELKTQRISKTGPLLAESARTEKTSTVVNDNNRNERRKQRRMAFLNAATVTPNPLRIHCSHRERIVLP